MMSDLKIKASPEPEFIEEIWDDQSFVDGTYYYYFDSPKWPHTIIDFEFSHDPGAVNVTLEKYITKDCQQLAKSMCRSCRHPTSKEYLHVEKEGR